MKNKLIKIISLVLILTLCATSAFAIQPETRWSNAFTITPHIGSLSDTYSVSVYGQNGTTNVSCSMTLYEKTWYGSYNYVASSSGSSASQAASFTGSYAMTDGKTYKLSYTVKVTKNGTVETISNYITGKG